MPHVALNQKREDPRLPYDFPADVYSLGCILTASWPMTGCYKRVKISRFRRSFVGEWEAKDMMDKAFCCSWYAQVRQAVARHGC